jgi:hypothetical protein
MPSQEGAHFVGQVKLGSVGAKVLVCGLERREFPQELASYVPVDIMISRDYVESRAIKSGCEQELIKKLSRYGILLGLARVCDISSNKDNVRRTPSLCSKPLNRVDERAKYNAMLVGITDSYVEIRDVEPC